MTLKSDSIAILGAGYVGRALAARHPKSLVTHRQPPDPTQGMEPGQPFHRFKLEEPATWAGLPLAGRIVVWTFPAMPLPLVQRFYQGHVKEAAALIVLGSTSAYKVEHPGQLVTEATPLDMTQPRVAGEEWLRQQGATILQLAGIFGPGREPLGWLQRGRIRSGCKLVNLIHVDDIVAAIEAIAERPQPGLRINVSNGQPLMWNELVAGFQRSGELPGEFELRQIEPGLDSKQIANERLRALMPGYAFRTPI
jgi:hypothetical protein